VLDPAPVGYPYRVRLEMHTLGPITVNFAESNWTQVSRPRSLIARSRRDPFVLLQPRTGRASFRLPHGEVTARPGECLFVDTVEPHEFLVREPTTTVGLTLPRQWLARWLPRPEHSPNLFSPNDSGWGAALCAVVGSLRPDSIDSLALPAISVAENIASLIALAAGRESQTPCPSLLSLLRVTLRECLHEPTLSARKLADRHHISLRKLHYAFADERTTFMQELVRMRVQRAQELLSDATLTHLGIAEVAVRCGFSDPSHFARRFRQQFQMTPLQYRRSTTE
jgi:AraC family transcriptional regulator, positive regulator of tynA and feaB